MISLQYLKENKDEINFLAADKHQRFLQIDAIQSCQPKYGQITQNSKFIISLQYLKKEMSNEVDILHAVKHQVFLQIDTIY